MVNFQELKVWVKAYKLTLAANRTTSTFLAIELYGLTSKGCRYCASIPINIAEGYGRNENVEICRFIQIAMGLASELEYYLLLAQD
ncbi:four helix bundle protein [Dapis sp. BLCC M229]|uniref:four helix bundle protein n=1 Tax=Dapis sp. BLCC M229 TaxID=3400188 RepID=UPI003CEC646C